MSAAGVPPSEAACVIRIEYETPSGDSRAIKRHAADRAPETVREAVGMLPRGALVDDIAIHSSGGESR